MKKFTLKNRTNSFRYAFEGIKLLVKEHNVWIHLFITVLVLFFSWWLKISRAEWIIVLFAIGLVLMAEGFNTAIEYLGNAISKEKNKNIQKAKDVAAGAVLIAAITSAIIGLLVFVPKIFDKLNF